MSGNSYACAKHDKMNHQKTVTTSATAKKSCCSEKSGDKKGCEGTCGHSTCKCTSACSSFSSATVSYLCSEMNSIDYAFTSMVKTNHNTPSISDGFSSLWLIPKIG